MRYRVLRTSKAELTGAVAPEPLASVLVSLRQSGAIQGFSINGVEVVLWGDLGSLEIAVERLHVAPATETQARAPDGRGTYFAMARRYCHTASFRRLSPLHRAIWRLHAEGVSFRKICVKLQVSEMKVRWAIRGARAAAKLPRVTSTVGRPTTQFA